MTSRTAARSRILKLTALALAFSLLLLARYGRHPDTATLSIVAHALVAPPGTDSTLYMRMGEAAFRSGDHRIYQQLFFGRHEKFIYPPSSLFLTEALDALPRLHLSTDIVWKLILLVGWLGSLITGMAFFRTRRNGASTAEMVSIALLGVLFLPFAEAFYRGQVQTLLTLLWGVSLLLWTRKKTGWAGFCLALTCMFKPQLAIFLVWGLLRREWRFTIVFATTAAVALVCSVARFGLQNHLDYLVVLHYLSRHGESLWANQSMNGLLNRLLRNGGGGWSATVYPPYRPIVYALSSCFSVLCFAAGLLLPWIAGWRRTTADFLFFGCISVLISPIAWEHHYGVFFFAFLYLMAQAESMSRLRWTLLMVCLLAISNRLPRLDFLPFGPVNLLTDYLFFSAIVVLVLLALNERARFRTALIHAGTGVSDKLEVCL